MSWNYRLVRFPDPASATNETLVIKEVYYDDAGKPIMYGDGDIVGEDVADMKGVVALMLEAFDKEPIDASVFGVEPDVFGMRSIMDKGVGGSE